ncbi:ankyrin repeat domain-containing protein [Aspergillus mulundensis]|uniref:Ankyrin repeat protein n=1 Tax=Aspergillus mulundensis TaxID=1810919 RepID=A0A3D8RE62_9EURO|nr:hypothetical protein DSM5745_07517 [Aspergillus mulundensis]RDW72345.1 hypothetical protein DSM5745_07517 [Aspergillus mulundensis]
MAQPTTDLLYALLLDTVCHKPLEELKSILPNIPRDVISQLKYDGRTPKGIINALIVQRYYQLHDRLEWDRTVTTPAGADSARYKQDFEAVKLLLAHGFNPQDIAPEQDGYDTISPVQLAAQTDDHEVLQLLLEAGADPVTHYDDGCSSRTPFDATHPPFQLAVLTASPAALQCLIDWSRQHPDSFSISENGKCLALRRSATHLFSGILQLLLSSFEFSESALSEALEISIGLDVSNFKWKAGSQYAGDHRYRPENVVWTAQIDIVRMLLEAGANPTHIDEDGNSTLHRAIGTAKGTEIIHLLLKHGVHAEPTDHKLTSLALHNGNTGLLRTFLDLGLIPTQSLTESVTCTPLHIAAAEASVDTLKFLVSTGFDPSAQDSNGWTPFHYACKCYSIENMKYLLDLNPHAVNQTTTDGWTALTIGYKEDAAPIEYSDGAAFLIESGAKVNVTTPDAPKYTPLHIAAMWTLWDTMDLLLQNGAQIIKAEGSGETPLHCLSCEEWDADDQRGVKALIEYGADVNAQDDEGFTLLHRLLRRHDPPGNLGEFVDVLLEAGADPSIRDKEGKTAKDWNDELPEDLRWGGSERMESLVEATKIQQ